MRYLILLSAVLFYINCHSQNYQENYKADICSCIEANKNEKIQTADKIYNACFTKHMIKYAVFIDAEIKEEDKTKKYIVGQKIRRELQEKFKYELVYSCNTYVDIIEKKRQRVIQQYRSKKIDSTKINKLNETVAMQPLWANYFNRGQYFYYIGDLQKAERDVLKSIEDNPLLNSDMAISPQRILLAMIYEEQKKYAKAIAIYDAINSKTITPSIAMLRAIVSRKSNGYRIPLEPHSSDSILNPELPKKPRITNRTRTAQKNTNTRKTSQENNMQKQKDSTKSLRSLFKLKQ